MAGKKTKKNDRMWFPNHSLMFLSIIFFCLFQSPALADKKSYIVYMGSHAHGPEITEAEIDAVSQSHHQLLGSYVGSIEKARDAIIYSYDRHINGFAAMLEEEEATEIAKNPQIVSVFLNQGRQLRTTHSWDFMSLEKDGVIHPSSLWRTGRFGEDVIIAHIDTGVWPESQSFSDEGMGAIPSRWKGTCVDSGVPCNRKLIGARYFNQGQTGRPDSYDISARDVEGHGTHTLSTAAGNFVPGANVFGLANGTIKGGSPRARVASYKVCWPFFFGPCNEADIMKAFDMAIHDGVDVISMSVGGGPMSFFTDAIAIGSFHAVQHGITVVCSAGNFGPGIGTVENSAPWIITVGASTLDREFESYVLLHNGKRFKGKSLSSSFLEPKFYPLITGEQAKASNASIIAALFCLRGSLDHEKVKGKILVCIADEESSDPVRAGYHAALAGAAGMILCNDKGQGNEIEADLHVLPASQVTFSDGLAVFDYINSHHNPLGYISPTTLKSGTKPAPVVASFSSRGPNVVAPEILKPDITAPGVGIIASFSEAGSPTYNDFDTRKTPFNAMSGTSMACPHVAGVVGLLKTLHPHWSAAAIRSAIMTTARTRANNMEPILDGGGYDNLQQLAEATPFAYGAGHIRPNRAQDPGLVYDLTVNDYLDFLCASGYNPTMIAPLFNGSYKCPESASISDFNYPSISIRRPRDSVNVTRKLKNVGSPGTYAVRIREPYGISVSVEPNILTFEKTGDEKSFKVTFKAMWSGKTEEQYQFGSLTWTDGKHYVRSPVAVIPPVGGD